MELSEIEAHLADPNSQERLKAITELKNYDSAIAVPLLLTKVHDPEFLVRSFVAMGLGKQRTSESFAALLEMMKFDRDSNVRAEAANSLSLFGEVTAPHLVQAFYQDDHWLVRRSILAALMEFNNPDELFEVSVCGLTGEDLSVQEASIEVLGSLGGTVQQKAALEQLLSKVSDSSWRIRSKVARALAKFEQDEARRALETLKQDQDSRVVGAVLESSL